jgi:alpha-glucosidase
MHADAGELRPGEPWWRTAVIYEVYPRSFADADGDGIGDLRGITSRLAYLAGTLGVDAIWICPFYPSPQIDFGYDISDYTGVDPDYGTLADFDALVAEAHRRGLRVIIDYVPNHSSDQHPWFTASRSSRDDLHRDWYIWADPAAGGGPPSNWTSEAGGSAWQFDDTTGQYYLHSFHRSQPDLNWRSESFRQAMLGVLGWWLEHDADGIRIDVAHLIAKHPGLADNPVRAEPLRNPTDRQHPDYDQQWHLNDRLHADVHDYLAMIRTVLDDSSVRTGRERVAIAELEALDWPVWGQFFGSDGEGVHLPFNFRLIETAWQPQALAAAIEGQEAALPAGAWPNNVLQNHDRPRLATRLGPEHVRVAAMLLLTLRGTPTLYYGEELGLPDLPIDPARWRDALGRDESRAPMPWDTCLPSKPGWLSAYPDLAAVSVKAQETDPASVLSLYRALISLRKRNPALLTGDYQTIKADDSCLCYQRSRPDQQLLIALNLGRENYALALPVPGRILLDTACRNDRCAVTELILPPHTGAVLALDP